MLEMLGYIVLAFTAVIAAIVAYAATRPSSFRIERSAAIKAPPEAIFAVITDFRNWPSWSPWQKLDPTMTQTLSGAASGTGAVSEWKGNSKVGSGRTEITGVTPPNRIAMRLDMKQPMVASNIVDYTLERQGGETRVTWAMHGPQPLMAKIFGLFVDCDKMVGDAFTEGLGNLKRIVEKA